MDRDRLTVIAARNNTRPVMVDCHLCLSFPEKPALTRKNVPTSTDNSRTERAAKDVPAGTFRIF